MTASNPPSISNNEAEVAVLGSMLINPGCVPELCGLLSETDFHDQRHGWIFAAMKAINDAGGAVDFVTVTDELERRKQLAEVRGASYVMDLINGVPTSIHATHYAGLVLRAAQDRAALRVAQRITQHVYQNRAGDGLTIAAQMLKDATGEHARANIGPVSLADAVRSMIDEASEREQQRIAGKEPGIMFPWSTMTEVIPGGLMSGDLMLIVGAPGEGKSTLAHQISDHAARFGHGVLMFITEMNKEQFAARHLAARAGVDSRKIRSGMLSHDEWARVFRATEEYGNLPIQIDCKTFDVGLLDLRIQQARQQLADAGQELRLVVFDFLQLFRDSKYRDKRTEVESGINTIRELTNSHGIASIVISQVSKDQYKNGAKPHIFGSKEAGGIEYAATIGLALWRQDGKIMCEVQKNREGRANVMVSLPEFNQQHAWYGSAKPYKVQQARIAA